MPLTREEKMKLHAEFMCAAMNGLIASKYYPTQDIPVAAFVYADAALEKYIERWEGEEKV